VLTSYVQGEDQGSQNGEKHEYIDPMFWSDCTDPERQTKKTKEQIAQEKAGRLARVKRILAASTRQDWEADGPRLWVHKGGDTELRIVDLTDDEGRVELKEEWARSAAGAGSVALRVELSICQGSDLLVKVPVVYVDSGRAFKRRRGRPASRRSLAVRPLQGHLTRGVSGRLPRSPLPAEGGHRRDLEQLAISLVRESSWDDECLFRRSEKEDNRSSGAAHEEERGRPRLLREPLLGQALCEGCMRRALPYAGEGSG
jgi:hypothetical protein